MDGAAQECAWRSVRRSAHVQWQTGQQVECGEQQVAPYVGIIRRQAERASKLCDGRVDIADVPQDVGEVRMSLGMVRLELQRALVRGHRLCGLALFPI